MICGVCGRQDKGKYYGFPLKDGTYLYMCVPCCIKFENSKIIRRKVKHIGEAHAK